MKFILQKEWSNNDCNAKISYKILFIIMVGVNFTPGDQLGLNLVFLKYSSSKFITRNYGVLIRNVGPIRYDRINL